MNGEIVFEPHLPLAAFVVIGGLALAVSLLGFLRGSRGAILRLAAALSLMALIANPQMRITERTPLDDVIVIVSDESASQSLDGRDVITRDAAAALEARLASLDGVEIVKAAATGDQETRLMEAIERAVADTPRGRLAGVFVITDGQASDAARSADFKLDAPLHLMTTGRAGEVDRKITLVNAPRYGIVRETAKLSFRIDDLGPNETPAEGGQAVVTLRIDGREAHRQSVPVGTEVSFEAVLDRPGGLIIELEAEPREGELTTRNNISVLPITAIRDRLRVLLISGEPHAGERVWRNLLKSDPSVDLVHFTILRPIEKGMPGEIADELALIPFPQDELFIDKLSAFDLLIFDRYSYRGVLNAFHFDNIARYVEGGGAVFVSTGPEYSTPASLAARRNFEYVLPATPAGDAMEQAYRPSVTEDGHRHPVTADLPEESFWGRWLRLLPAQVRRGDVLMTGTNDQPLRKESLSMGCVSMSNLFFKDGRISKKRFQNAVLFAKQKLEPIELRFCNRHCVFGAVESSGASGRTRNVGTLFGAPVVTPGVG